jgi:hypothetical protein
LKLHVRAWVAVPKQTAAGVLRIAAADAAF